MKKHLRQYGKPLMVAALALLLGPVLTGCETLTRANDEYQECSQCPPPEKTDKAIGEYQICQAYRLDRCRVLLGHDPEYDWSNIV